MSSRRRASRRKKINPHFWVFCEGKTEEAYIRYLRSEYRLPIEIIPKIAGCDISSRSRSLALYNNPSTNMHVFIEALENVREEKML